MERGIDALWRRKISGRTGEDSDYIFRDFGYEGADYRDQLRRRNDVRRKNAAAVKRDGETAQLEPLPPFYPVVTLVLYFGDTPWRGSHFLKDHLKIPEGLEKYVSNYQANIFQIAFLKDEEVHRFKSDFRYVAEYFVANRRKKEGEESPYSITLEHLKHVEEFAELMNAITNSDRFSDIPKIVNERGDKSVYTLLFDEREAKGAIRVYHEDYNLSPKEILQKIIQKFSLPEDEAASYVESTLGLAPGSVKPILSEGAAPEYKP